MWRTQCWRHTYSCLAQCTERLNFVSAPRPPRRRARQKAAPWETPFWPPRSAVTRWRWHASYSRGQGCATQNLCALAQQHGGVEALVSHSHPSLLRLRLQDGNRALHLAAQWGHAETIEVLTDLKAGVDAENSVCHPRIAMHNPAIAADHCRVPLHRRDRRRF